MVIGIDGNDANVEKRVGVSVYTYYLLLYFSNLASNDKRCIVYLRNNPLPHMPKPNAYFTYRLIKARFLWSQIFLPLHLIINRPVDVFFTPHHYAPRFCPVPFVITIHDVAYEYFPDEFLPADLYKLRNWTRYSVRNASKIICVSKKTQKDLQEVYGVPKDKTTVIYNGYKAIKTGKNEGILTTLGLKTQQYILHVGTLQPRKNLTFLIQAFHAFLKDNPHFKLVLTGKKGWMYEEILRLPGALGIEKQVIFTQYVTDGELIALYEHAWCYTMPSLYEGFGIPVLEAMYYGCPVIASNMEALQEIGADACLYFSPTSKEELLQAWQRLKDKQLRSALIKKGKIRALEFSWEKTARQTWETITNIKKGDTFLPYA